jgi:tetraacyldisaccharide 4'-kinase
MRFQERMADLHYQTGDRRSPWLWLLFPLAAAYKWAISARLEVYRAGWLRSFKSPVPVISVGNLTTGGTGKTPLVIALTRGLVEAGKTVVVLSRGYGAEEPLAYGRALDPKHGDEAYIIQAQVPEAVVIVGRDRVQTLRRAVRDYRPDYVILDDGFQYLRLQRDVNILLIDGERLVGNGHLLPVGPLREPLSQLRRADVIFVTKGVSQESLQTVESWVKRYHSNPLSPQIPVIPVPFRPSGLCFAGQQPSIPLERFADRPVLAVSGIARPEAFERDLLEAGLRLLTPLRFNDHHVYTPADGQLIERLLSEAQAENPKEQGALLVTTDKDWPKLSPCLSSEWQKSAYTLQTVPALDGRWFYDEFLTQMPGHTRLEDAHIRSGHGA